MRVVFLEDVEGVANGGEVKEVKNGFARNYLIPKNLAVPATHDALQRVRKLAEAADKARVRRLNDMKALGEEVSKVRVTVAMRSGSGGRLYGSVTPAMVAARLGELTGAEIDRRSVTLPESVRTLGEHVAGVRLHAEVQAEVDVLVHPMDVEPDEYLERLKAAQAEAEVDDMDADSEDDEEGEGEGEDQVVEDVAEESAGASDPENVT